MTSSAPFPITRRSVFCTVSARAFADLILHELRVAGYASTEISVLFLDRRTVPNGPSPDETLNAAHAPTAPSSTEIRGVMAWVDGIHSLVIPASARLIVAGPIAPAFSATTTGIAGGLIDFGLPTAAAAKYEQRLKEGQILLAVHVNGPEACARAREFFTIGGAEEILTLSPTPTPGQPSLSSSQPTTVRAADSHAK